MAPGAPFVLLPSPARAGFVASFFVLRRGGRGRARRHSHRACAQGRRTALLLSRLATCAVRAIDLSRSAFCHLTHEGWRRRRWRVALDLHAVDVGDDRGLDPIPELVEHLERFVLVLDEGIALPVRAEPDAFAEVLHLGQVLHPLPVDRAQHHVPFHHRHQVCAHLFDLAVIRLRGGRKEVLDETLGPVLQRLVRDLRARRQTQVRRQGLYPAVPVPVLGVAALAVLVDALLDDLADVAHDVAAGIGALEDLPPLLVHDLALLVHHVVLLDHVLAGGEMHAFDFLLRARDRTRDPWMFDRLHLEAGHEPPDAVGGRTKDLHQVVLQRDEESAGARVALAPGATAQLVVDAAALVALGANDVQALDIGDAGPEHDVGAAAGHVHRDYYRARLSGLRHGRRLALVLLGVEHVVLDAATLEHLRKP